MNVENKFWLALLISVNGRKSEVSTDGTGYKRIEFPKSLTLKLNPGIAGFEHFTEHDLIFSYPTKDWGKITALGIYDSYDNGNLLFCSNIPRKLFIGLGQGGPMILNGQTMKFIKNQY